jgi:hypothetical protein
MVILALDNSETEWLIDFFREAKGKVRQDIDTAFIDHLLQALDIAKKHRGIEKGYANASMNIASNITAVINKMKAHPPEVLQALHAAYSGLCLLLVEDKHVSAREMLAYLDDVHDYTKSHITHTPRDFPVMPKSIQAATFSYIK